MTVSFFVPLSLVFFFCLPICRNNHNNNHNNKTAIWSTQYAHITRTHTHARKGKGTKGGLYAPPQMLSLCKSVYRCFFCGKTFPKNFFQIFKLFSSKSISCIVFPLIFGSFPSPNIFCMTLVSSSFEVGPFT